MQNQLEMGMSDLESVMNHGLRVAIYVRVSTEEQAEQGFFIEKDNFRLYEITVNYMVKK